MSFLDTSIIADFLGEKDTEALIEQAHRDAAALKPIFSRQMLRNIGRKHALKKVNEGAPGWNRRARKRLARDLHAKAWEKRDKSLVAKVTHRIDA